MKYFFLQDKNIERWSSIKLNNIYSSWSISQSLKESSEFTVSEREIKQVLKNNISCSDIRMCFSLFCFADILLFENFCWENNVFKWADSADFLWSDFVELFLNLVIKTAKLTEMNWSSEAAKWVSQKVENRKCKKKSATGSGPNLVSTVSPEVRPSNAEHLSICHLLSAFARAS